jgi:hypothetical protein
VPNAAHLSTVEEPDVVAKAVADLHERTQRP